MKGTHYCEESSLKPNDSFNTAAVKQKSKNMFKLFCVSFGFSTPASEFRCGVSCLIKEKTDCG